MIKKAFKVRFDLDLLPGQQTAGVSAHTARGAKFPPPPIAPENAYKYYKHFIYFS